MVCYESSSFVMLPSLHTEPIHPSLGTGAAYPHHQNSVPLYNEN